MKKYTGIVFLFVILLSTATFAQPKIEPLEKHYDFGNINQGDVVTHDFVVKNVGTEKLVIDKVKASCGCTAAAPDKNEIEPGDSTSIKVKFDSHGRKGIQKKYVYIFSNDPEQKQLRLTFTTKIIEHAEVDKKKVNKESSSELEISQSEVDFGDVESGQKKENEIYFINKGKADLIINEIKSTCECITASVSKYKLLTGEVGIMKIFFDSSNRNGEITRTLMVLSNDPISPEQTIVVHANVTKGDKS